VQGIFQVAAVLPVNYVIQEMEDIFNPNNDVSLSQECASLGYGVRLVSHLVDHCSQRACDQALDISVAFRFRTGASEM